MDPFVEQIVARTHARQVSLQQRSGQRGGLHGCEGMGGAPGSLKRPRDPLSGNKNLLSSGHPDGLKRRCLDLVGDENFNPLQQQAKSPTRPRLRRAELEVKPDTPAISSIKSRLKVLAERKEAGDAVLSGVGLTPLALKSLSGSGEEEHRTGFHPIGDTEFRSRMERFEMGSPQDGPSLSTPRPRVLSGFARTIQQKLQRAETPSTSRAQLIRQEREQELILVRAQPITDNAWLKRSWSDTSLAEAEPSVQAQDAGNSVSCDGPKTEDGSAVTLPAFTKESRTQTGYTDAELSSPEELSTSKMIDQMFMGVLDTTEEEEEEEEEGQNEDEEGQDEEEEGQDEEKEGADKEEEEEGNLATESQEDRTGQQEGVKRGEDHEPQENSDSDLFSVPPSCLLSPLSKAVEAVVTPLRLACSPLIEALPILSPEETTSPPAETAPLYSIDAYRTQRQSSQNAEQCVTPATYSRAVDVPRPQPPVNTKERIMLLSEEAGRLQSIISQTLQALSCCTDPGHGQGSLEEAEAEKLLLVSCEKRSALLAEVSRLRDAGGCNPASDGPSQEPCRGTVTISHVKLPLKEDFVSSVRSQTGRPTHYFFILIRYGVYNIVATPLATAADALNGDTLSFPTSVSLRDVPSSFEVDVEVFSLSRCTGSNVDAVRRSTKSKVTPKKLLNTITRTNHSMTPSSLSSMGPRRSSNFALVGCHRITLQSLGQSKFPLDKMKFEGKVRKLLGDEFQEKVPFLSPLEGSIYLQLGCEGHSYVQHHGFLTVFEDVSGFGAWHRRWFCLEGGRLSYWSYPSDEHSKAPEGSISLLASGSQRVQSVNRDSCARPHTFELASTRALQQGDDRVLDKRWFSADTREERVQWMEKLGQALLDLQTWNLRSMTHDGRPFTPSFSEPPRESVL
ncbi:hypothetical protein AAFF_G00287040 [Aldrovandia affinis]|uniref:Anillin n=1 Tax=Aldrovandia affinis TaxID=143900 RepID=A0AAD7X1Y6_9TELE|nr:hypothetical protein AAFF_G00287040 [Aldrovandia affinis]